MNIETTNNTFPDLKNETKKKKKKPEQRRKPARMV